MPVVRNTLLLPGGTPDASATVEVRLRPSSGLGEVGGFIPTTDSSVVGVLKTRTSSVGLWSITLEGNANIQPAGTYYEVKEFQKHRPNPVISRITVPTTGGPYHLYDVLNP